MSRTNSLVAKKMSISFEKKNDQAGFEPKPYFF